MRQGRTVVYNWKDLHVMDIDRLVQVKETILTDDINYKINGFIGWSRQLYKQRPCFAND